MNVYEGKSATELNPVIANIQVEPRFLLEPLATVCKLLRMKPVESLK